MVGDGDGDGDGDGELTTWPHPTAPFWVRSHR